METLSLDQQQISDQGLLAQASVINLPTGGGKTWLARKAVAITLEKGLKAVYLSPLRAIAKELSVAWRDEFSGRKIGVYTGEVGVDAEDNPSVSEAEILICTPEKFDLFLRGWIEQLEWLAKVDVVIVDEFHMLDSGRRGATLEGLLTRFSCINPYARVMALSATLGNPEELAKWIGGKAYVSKKRPVPLSWRIKTYSKNEPKANAVIDEVIETIKEDGRVVVFVQSRPRTESLVSKLAEAGIEAVAHHAGLSQASRDKAENAFRSGKVSVLVGTPTLSAGVNVPARKVILHDLQRFSNGDWVDLMTNEVWQMGGRAGRKGLDASGEVVLLAPVWNQKAARRYIKGEFEAIQSQLHIDQYFSEQLMVTFGSRMALKQDQSERILSKSLYAQAVTPPSLSKRVDVSIKEMVSADMLDMSPEGFIRATRLGRVATRFQLTAKTVIGWKRLEEGLRSATLFDIMVAICASHDFTARLRVEHDDVEMLQSAMNREPMNVKNLTYQQRKGILGCAGKDLVGAVRTALVLRAWTRLGDVCEAGEQFNAMEHEVEEARKEAVRLLQAFSAMLQARPNKVELEDGDVGLVEKVDALCSMVCAGLDDEGATLALIDGVGPKMARKLVNAGFEDIECIAQADPNEIGLIDGISVKRALKWVEEAGDLMANGGAYRYKEACKKIQTSEYESKVMKGLDYYRWTRASTLDVLSVGGEWNVRGGSEEHTVIKTDHDKYECDCHDAKKGRLCKHKISVMHEEGVDGIPRFYAGFPASEGGFDLEMEWSSVAWNQKVR